MDLDIGICSEAEKKQKKKLLLDYLWENLRLVLYFYLKRNLLLNYKSEKQFSHVIECLLFGLFIK